jgi:hypothetical protein
MRFDRTALAVCFAIASLSFAPPAFADGSRSFVMRPRVGAAVLNLPSRVAWTEAGLPNGAYRVALTADVDLRSVQANIKPLSAKALNRSGKCSDTVKVRDATARLTGARTLTYGLKFHFVKRMCAGGYPLELPAEVDCAARIALAAQRSVVAIDVQGARNPPCNITGAYQGVSQAVSSLVGVDVFKRHVVDLSRHLPPEFKGVTIDITSLSFDLPPAAAKLHIAGESVMSAAQFRQFMARADAARPKTH